MKQFGIAIHGGAGTIYRSLLSKEAEENYHLALRKALHTGYSILDAGGSSLNAVEAAVVVLEDCPLFNAGKGSVFTNLGKHEMDASIMDGRLVNGGAVSLVNKIKNPVRLARMVMDHSPHVFLAGEGAELFAKEEGIEFIDPEYFFTEERYQQFIAAKSADEILLDHTVTNNNKFGTVGAVALDRSGNLASATSTGGMTNKKWGRIGDTPILGAGTYANNQTCAVSCTGSGEYFIRSVVAFQVHSLMLYAGLNLIDSCYKLIHEILPAIDGDGGLIAIDREGNICMDFNTEGMYRGYKNSSGEELTEIYRA